MATTAAPPDGVDQRIADALRHAFLPGQPAAFGALTALGAAAVRRAVDLYYRTDSKDQPEPVAAVAGSRHPRETVDAWSAVLETLALAYPEDYLTEITSGRVVIPERHATTEIVILGQIRLPAAATELHRRSDHADWLVRLHVVRGLAHRDDAASVRVIERAVTDEEQLICDEAADVLLARDPEAAARLYETLVREVGSALQDELRRRLTTARRAATTREPRREQVDRSP